MALNGFHFFRFRSINCTYQFYGVFQGNVLNKARYKCTYVLPRANQLRIRKCSRANGCADEFLQIKSTNLISGSVRVVVAFDRHLNPTFVFRGQHQWLP